MHVLPAKVSRDHRVDLLRGLALASIFINHMPGNWLEDWTTRNFGFSDAAEVFVLLAGFAAAMAFYPRFLQGERLAIGLKIGRRAGVLFAAHLATTLAAVALFWAFASLARNPDALDLIGIGPLVSDPMPGLKGLLIGGHQLGYFNILPLYVVLLALLPAMLWLASRDLRLLAGASLGLYLAANAGGLALPNYPNDGNWFFNPFAWQILFVTGLGLGILRLEGRGVGYYPAVFGLAVAYLAFSAVWMIGSLGGIVGGGYVPDWLGPLHKTNVPATRLLHVLALAYVLGHSRAWGWLARIPQDFILTRMGRKSLPVFMAGSMLSMVGWIVLIQTGGGFVLESIVVALGLSLMGGLALVLERDKPVAAKGATPALPRTVYADPDRTPTISMRG